MFIGRGPPNGFIMAGRGGIGRIPGGIPGPAAPKLGAPKAPEEGGMKGPLDGAPKGPLDGAPKGPLDGAPKGPLLGGPPEGLPHTGTLTAGGGEENLSPNPPAAGTSAAEVGVAEVGDVVEVGVRSTVTGLCALGEEGRDPFGDAPLLSVGESGHAGPASEAAGSGADGVKEG
jgi:hypothetical protein